MFFPTSDSFEVLAHHARKADDADDEIETDDDVDGEPAAMVMDNKGNLWIGFQGNGKVRIESINPLLKD